MILVYRCADYDGQLMYNQNCVIGIYNDMSMSVAKYDLLKQLDKLKYTYELEFDTDDYIFAKCLTKKGIELCNNPIPCFEIMKRKLDLNEIKLRS
jgi:hypothetical protein